MKIIVATKDGQIYLTGEVPFTREPTILGTVEVTEPPKEPIKMTIPIVPPDDARGTFSVRLELPVDAKNIRCTYEVEE